MNLKTEEARPTEHGREDDQGGQDDVSRVAEWPVFVEQVLNDLSANIVFERD